MDPLLIEASRKINASPEAVYEVLSDYIIGHPAILPKPYFADLVVEEGGQGDGTVIRVKMNVWGIETDYRFVVHEPETGKLLVETDADAGVKTTFKVEPLPEGEQTRVTLTTLMPASPGIKGFFEKVFTPIITRIIYNKELQNLADYLQEA